MQKSPGLLMGLMAAFAIAGTPQAGHAGGATVKHVSTEMARATEKDFGRLSREGVSAFNDIQLARQAIFDGTTDEAAKFVADAKASLAKAKVDDTVFMKAESAMQVRTPAGAPAPSASVIAWIPIDSELTLGESFVSTPEKAAAVVTARKNLEKGENGKALESIRLAQLDLNFTVAVAPLNQSIADIDQANTLIVSHDYYGASQALRHAEDGVRYDEFDDVGNVKAK